MDWIWSSPILTTVLTVVLLVVRHYFCAFLSRNALRVQYNPESPWYVKVMDAIERQENAGTLEWLSSNTLKLVLGVGLASFLPSLVVAVLGPVLNSLVKFVYKLIFKTKSQKLAKFGFFASIAWSVLASCYQPIRLHSTGEGGAGVISEADVQRVNEILIDNPDITQEQLNAKLTDVGYSGTGTTW
jgi:hypothetical protein